MQRDRAFSSYEDLEASYQRRPSAWVEPVGDWGAGRVELLQFGTPDETHDNIAAYWVADAQPAPGKAIDVAWRVHWTLDPRRTPELATVTQTRVGHGYREAGVADARQQLHVDFSGPVLQGLVADDAVQVLASGNANVRNLRAIAYPNRERGGWRVSLEFERIEPSQPLELRAQLMRAGSLLSETWAFASAPE
jgi:glucans biosynthesis protein